MDGAISPVRHVSQKELSDWRTKAWRNSGGGRNRRRYGVSQGARSPAPEVTPNERGDAEVEVEALGAPRSGRQLVEIMERRRQEMLGRLERMTPEAKLEMVRHLRLVNPALLADWPDDNEAVLNLTKIIRREAEEIAKRALIRAGRDATILYRGR